MINEYEENGMRYPAIDQLVDKADSKYKLVMATAVRAKQLDAGAKPLIEHPKNKKSIGIALEEIENDKIKIRRG